jgi:hypothetical protein
VVHCNNLFTHPSQGEYQSILGGIPQKLVSKFHISYSLILNLLKNGQTKDFHLFSQKSMIHREICNLVHGQLHETNELKHAIDAKEEYVKNARTSPAICNEYIDTMHIFCTTTNKKRKQAEKQLQLLTDANRYIIEDVKRVNEWTNMKSKYDNDMDSLKHTEHFIQSQTESVCGALEQYGFVSMDDDTFEYTLTSLGVIASNMAETHPLVISQLMCKWNYFEDFSKKQIVGLISCFTDVKVNSDMRASIPLTDDSFLKFRINELEQTYEVFAQYECDNRMNTGIQYESALQYDIIDMTMSWCDCTSIEECKLFIQTNLAEKEISVGDFTKAMLKVVTIVKEWMNVFEQIGNVEALHRFSGIETLILKYITTSQSLYV